MIRKLIMEITFRDILQIIKKNIIFILIISIIFALCSFFVTKFFIPKSYKATVKLYVKTSYDVSNSYEGIQSYNYAKTLVATYIQMLDTNSFYSTVSDALNEKYTASQLSSMISFSSIEDTEIFQASVVSQSPTEAKSIADAIAATAPEAISKVNNDAQLKIVDDATVPKSPTSPNVNRNVLLAFLAGLIISLIFAFIRDYFDVKIKYNDDMTTIAGLAVLAAIPDFENFTNNRSVSVSKSADSSTNATESY